MEDNGRTGCTKRFVNLPPLEARGTSNNTRFDGNVATVSSGVTNTATISADVPATATPTWTFPMSNQTVGNGTARNGTLFHGKFLLPVFDQDLARP